NIVVGVQCEGEAVNLWQPGICTTPKDCDNLAIRKCNAAGLCVCPREVEILMVRLVRRRDGTGRDGTGRDGTERDGTGRNEGVIFEKDMGYICLKMVKHCVPRTWNKPVPGGEVERKNTQNLSRGTARSTHFWRTKRGTERLVPFRPVPSHVPNAPLKHTRYTCEGEDYLNK
ncbi:hypothetical protein DVH24_030683, partial [Malus domestica]